MPIEQNEPRLFFIDPETGNLQVFRCIGTSHLFTIDHPRLPDTTIVQFIHKIDEVLADEYLAEMARIYIYQNPQADGSSREDILIPK